MRDSKKICLLRKGEILNPLEKSVIDGQAVTTELPGTQYLSKTKAELEQWNPIHHSQAIGEQLMTIVLWEIDESRDMWGVEVKERIQPEVESHIEKKNPLTKQEHTAHLGILDPQTTVQWELAEKMQV